MPEKRTATRKTTTVKKTAAKAAAPKKATSAKTSAVVHKAVAPAAATPEQPRTSAEVCPRCGTEKFAPEQRIRAEGNRTVRYTILVCERGHTFARPITRPG